LHQAVKERDGSDMLSQRHRVKTHLWIFHLFLAAFLLISSSCGFFPPSTPSTPSESPQTESLPEVDRLTTTPETSPTKTTSLPAAISESVPQHRQWAISAVDLKGSEEAAFVLGKPDAEGCELNPRESVWVYQSDSSTNASNYLQLFFAQPVLPVEVIIHLAYTHSAITQVTLIDLQGQPHEIYRGAPGNLAECPTELTLTAEDLTLPVYAVRIDVSAAELEAIGLTAIDAVELVGKPLAEAQATPIPTPYLRVSSLGFRAADVPEGFVHFEVFDNHTGERIAATECDAFSYNLTDTERTIRLFSCEGSTEIWLYVPPSFEIGAMPLNSYPLFPTARLLFEGKTIPAMEGEMWVDQVSDTHMTGVLEFKGFDTQNQVDYYRVAAVFNQIPLTEEAARKPGDMIVQWALGSTASSEWSGDDNAAAQAAGPSDTWMDCEAAQTTWKPDPEDAQPWLELTYQTPVKPTDLNILFSGSPKTILEVNLLSPANSFPLNLSTARVLEGCPQTLAFDPITIAPIEILGVQILLDPEALNQDFGIDAVQLIGIIGE
jgi:hypothetical protein